MQPMQLISGTVGCLLKEDFEWSLKSRIDTVYQSTRRGAGDAKIDTNHHRR